MLDLSAEQLRSVTIPPSWMYDPRYLGGALLGMWIWRIWARGRCYMNSLMQLQGLASAAPELKTTSH